MSALVFNRLISVSGVPANADSTPTISIIRTDTSATVVATTSTGITNPSTGQYSYTLTNPIAGVTYQSTWTFIVDGQTFAPTKSITAPDSILPIDWHYSDKAAFEIFNGYVSTNIEDDLNSQNTSTDDQDESNDANDDILNDAGTRGDAYIDGRLAALGWTVPLTAMDARTTTTLRDLSNHACRWQLAESSNYALFTSGTTSIEQAAKTGKADKKYVDDFFQQLQDGETTLVATGGPSTPSASSASGRISVSVGHEKVYPGTQGIAPRAHRRGIFVGGCW